MKQLLLAFLLILSTPLASISQTPDILARSFSSIVQVTVPSEDPKEYRFCTGVRVGIVRVLTAEHCFPDPNADIKVNGLPARLVKKNDWLALLDIPAEVPGAIQPIATKEPPIGAEVTSTGYVDIAGTRLSLHRRIAFLRPDFTFIDGPLISGMSGGPVIDSNGQLVGINQAATEHAGMLTNVKDIREFIK